MNRQRTVVLLLCVLWVGQALALERMRAPKASLVKGQFSGAIEQSFSSEDVEVTGSYVGPGVLNIKDVESKRYYLYLGYGISDPVDLFFRLGSADADYDDPSLEFEGDGELAWSYGIKSTFFRRDNMTIGGLAQMSWITSEGGGLGSNWETDYDAYEIQIAAGPTFDMGKWSFYGGPFLYILRGDFDFNIPFSGRFSADVEEESSFGGFVGANLALSRDISAAIDYAMTGDGYAVGVSLGWRF